MKFKHKIPFLGVLLAFSVASCSPAAAPSSEPLSPSSVPPASSEAPSETPSSDLPSSEVSSEIPSSLPEVSSIEPSEGLPDLGEPALAIHYHREDNAYDPWGLWLWQKGGAGKRYSFNYTDDYGAVALYPLSTWSNPVEMTLGFIVYKGDWEKKDIEDDRYLAFTDIEMDAKQTYHYYLYTEDPSVYTDPSIPLSGFVKGAKFTGANKIFIEASKPIQSIKIYEGETIIVDQTYASPQKSQFAFLGNSTVNFEKDYTYEIVLTTGREAEGNIDVTGLYSTDVFNNAYAYDGELGAIYTPESTTFRVWSPFSSEITLNIYNSGTPDALGGSDRALYQVAMTRGEKGTFETTVNGDFEGKYYTYSVTNKKYEAQEIVDPYAKSAGINGLRGMIVDFSKTNPDGWDEVNHLGYDRKELTVYETHVADVTSSKTWNGDPQYQKLFKGMCLPNTTYTEGDVTVKTGFDHIKELGVNAVQILPLFDQDNDETDMTFNWGYNPLNYNVVEGGYSTNPYDGYTRIREFKELVQAYNEAGIEIIMDVVYNHVSRAIGSNFDVLLPGYFYRYVNGGLSNGSGCGNETASENYMFRKFMIDSTEFWLREYKLAGFRFDLMGLHDIETMNLLVENAKKVNPDVVIYGEPWTGGSTPLPENKQAIQKNTGAFVGFGQFNDRVRNDLHGGVFDYEVLNLGWASENELGGVGSMSRISQALFGTTYASGSKDPNKTVNYVTCHDNRTLFDRIVATGQYDAEKDYDTIVNIIAVAHSVVFLSNGTSFMLAGEEFARTKGGDSNSYQSSYEVNELDYSLKIKNINLFNQMKSFIHLKQTLPFFQLEEENLIYNPAAGEVKNCFYERGGMKNSSIMMKIVYEGQTLVVIHNNGIADDPVTYDLEGYSLVYDSLIEEKELTSSTVTTRFETLVAIQSE